MRSSLTTTTDGHKLSVRWDRGSLVVELYAPIITSEDLRAKMRGSTLVLTMHKMSAAETWPSFERGVQAQSAHLETDGGDDFSIDPGDGTLDIELCTGDSPGGSGEGARLKEIEGLGPRRNTPPPTQHTRAHENIHRMVAEQSALDIADAASNESKRRRVYVNVYILVGDATSDALLSSLTGGGLYHSGIEVDGVEYAFRGGHGRGTGIWRQPPRGALPPSFENASYKESLYMGMTWPLTPAELHHVIASLGIEWRKNQYNLLTRNWCVAREGS